jgi:hypothetical protein
MKPTGGLVRWWRRVNRPAGGWLDAAPDAGVYIGRGAVAIAAISSSTRRYQLLASRIDPLPDGAVVPSPVESNIRQPQVVIDCLKAAAAMSRRREVALSLPDPVVRVAILELVQLPARRIERDALFQHHLEQLFLTSLGRCRFAFQWLPSSADGQRRILVSAIREPLLEEYESVVRAAGLVPAVVDIAAFHLYNLYEEQLFASAPVDQCALFLNLFDQNFTIMLVDREGPRLIRIKALPATLADADVMARVMAEVEASIRAAQLATVNDESQPAVRLFMFGDRPLPDLDRQMRDVYQAEVVRLHQNGRAAGPDHAPAGDQAGGSSDDAGPSVADAPERPALTTALAAAVSAAGGSRDRAGEAS